MSTRNKAPYQSGVIYIPARKKKHILDAKRSVVRIDPKVYNALVDIYNDSTLPMSVIASMLILDAAGRVQFVKEDEDDYETV